MYESYFGLIERPFSIAPDPQYLYMSSRHKEAMAHLTYGLSQGGCFIVLTGEVGTGKTTLCRNLLGQLPDKVDVALILNANINEMELLQTICDERKIPYAQDTTQKQLLDLINNYLLETFSQNRHTVLIIDEAQLLSRDVLEQIRLLTNLETNKAKLLQIILIGQPELNDLLRRNDLRQLAQRVTARYHLGALERSEIDEYVNFRLGVAGCKKPLFSRQALNKLHVLSEGIPRKINVLADHALLAAYSRSQALVDSKIVKTASKDVFIDSAPKNNRSSSVIWLFRWWPALVLAVLLNIGLWWVFSGGQVKPLISKTEQTPAIASDQDLPQQGEQPNSPLLGSNASAESQANEHNSSTIRQATSDQENSSGLDSAPAEPVSTQLAAPGRMIVSDEPLDDSIDPELKIEAVLSEASISMPTHTLAVEPLAIEPAIQSKPSPQAVAGTELGLLLETSAHLTGRIAAMRNLAGVWGEVLPDQLIQPTCQLLVEADLRCHAFKGWQQMLRFNRPAVLVLNHGDQLHRVIVVSVSDDKVDVLVGDQHVSVPVQELKARWDERGLLFWRPNKSLVELYQEGDRSVAVAKVKALLNGALKAANMPMLESPDSSEFDMDVSQKTFALQTRFGIIGDSRIGRETQMLINELNWPDMTPVLSKRLLGN